MKKYLGVIFALVFIFVFATKVNAAEITIPVEDRCYQISGYVVTTNESHNYVTYTPNGLYKFYGYTYFGEDISTARFIEDGKTFEESATLYIPLAWFSTDNFYLNYTYDNWHNLRGFWDGFVFTDTGEDTTSATNGSVSIYDCNYPPAIDGLCGADHYNCINGTSTSIVGSSTTHWLWTCDGANGGETVSCNEPFEISVVNGDCGDHLYECNAGQSVNNFDNTWNCNGIGGGNNAFCIYSTSTQQEFEYLIDYPIEPTYEDCSGLDVGCYITKGFSILSYNIRYGIVSFINGIISGTVKIFEYLFVPHNAYNNFNELKDRFASSSPFGYIPAIYNEFESMQNASNSSSTVIIHLPYFTDISLNINSIDDTIGVDTLNAIRAILGAFLVFGTLFTIYKITKHAI